MYFCERTIPTLPTPFRHYVCVRKSQVWFFVTKNESGILSARACVCVFVCTYSTRYRDHGRVTVNGSDEMNQQIRLERQRYLHVVFVPGARHLNQTITRTKPLARIRCFAVPVGRSTAAAARPAEGPCRQRVPNDIRPLMFYQFKMKTANVFKCTNVNYSIIIRVYLKHKWNFYDIYFLQKYQWKLLGCVSLVVVAIVGKLDRGGVSRVRLMKLFYDKSGVWAHRTLPFINTCGIQQFFDVV